MRCLNELLIQGIDKEELEIICLQFFGKVSTAQKENTIIYSRNDKKPLLEFKYKNDQIQCIDKHDGFSNKDFNELKITIKRIADNTNNVKSLRRGILFSDYPIKGFCEVGDFINLVPVPSRCPKSPGSGFVMWGKYPFIVEYSYSRNIVEDKYTSLINAKRWYEKYSEIALLLNLLLERGVVCFGNSAKHSWLMNNKGKSYYGTLGYGCNNFKNEIKEYTKGRRKINEIDPKQYYSRMFLKDRNSKSINMEVPNDLIESIKTYYSLNGQIKRRFLDSCYWLHVSKQVIQYSISAAYIAMVNSVEVFLNDGGTRCKCCNQLKMGIAKQFRKFIDKYSPGINDSLKKQLYDLRSRLNHGDKIMWGDRTTTFFAGSATNFDDQNKFWAMQYIIKNALHNWLVEKGQQREAGD
jgi:hypothetical protein